MNIDTRVLISNGACLGWMVCQSPKKDGKTEPNYGLQSGLVKMSETEYDGGVTCETSKSFFKFRVVSFQFSQRYREKEVVINPHKSNPRAFLALSSLRSQTFQPASRIGFVVCLLPAWLCAGSIALWSWLSPGTATAH